MESFLRSHIADNIFSSINKARCNDLKKEFLLYNYFHKIFKKKYRYEWLTSHPKRTNFIQFNYKGGVYYVSVEKLINIFHFLKEHKLKTIQEIDTYVEKSIFLNISKDDDNNQKIKNKMKKSHKDEIRNFKNNFQLLSDLLGNKFIRLLEAIFPEVSQFQKDKGNFHPKYLYIVEGFDTMTKEICKLFNCDRLFHFKAEEFIYLVECYWRVRGNFHFPSFVSFILIFVDYYIDCCKTENTDNLFSLFVGGIESPSYQDIFSLATSNGMDLEAADLNTLLTRPYEQEGSGASTDFDENWEKYNYGFHNPHELAFNIAILESSRDLKIFEDILSSQNTRKEIEKLGTKIRTGSKSRSVQEGDKTKYIDLKSGLVAEYSAREGNNYLVGVFPLQKEEFIKWVAKNIMFHTDLLVRKFKNFETACASYEKRREALDYRRNRGHWNCKNFCGDKKCRKRKPTEFHIKLIILRFLREQPFMKNASTAAVHLAKHGGGSERVKMLRGENLDEFCKQYFAIASSLILLEPETNFDWIAKQSDKFKYNFSRSGNIIVPIGSWDVENKAIMCYITITGNNDIYLKSLFVEFPKNEEQAACFGWGREMWEQHEANLKSKEVVQ